LIKKLRHLQHKLETVLRTNEFIHNKLVNACQEISACQYACFKSSETLAELINDLKSSIMTYQKSHFIEAFFTNRRYYKNFSSRENREYQNRKYQNRINQNRRNQDQKQKRRCFVCQKEEC
jgi:Na+-translocating ferredoxin:NAD+ oxidoreductase RnfC subunit